MYYLPMIIGKIHADEGLQLVEHNTTLATLRAHIWKNGGDVVLHYKSNGRKPEIEKILANRAATMSAAETSGKVGPTIHT